MTATGTSTAAGPVAAAIASGRLGGRLWFYANYHCNLTCTYCLTESGPRVEARLLDTGLMRRLAGEAAGLGFTGLGVTGGEPFLVRDMPEVLADLAATLPTVVLSNGTLFSRRLLDRLRPLAGLPLKIQISLDRAEPVPNDEMRGPENFRKVVEAVPRLVDAGIGVRIATTIPYEEISPELTPAQERLCALHRALGVGDPDHVVRPIVARGRARLEGLGVAAGVDDLQPELTITADGAFWNPFAPTVAGGRLDTDLLVTRTVEPLATPAAAMLRLVEGRPAGADATLGIR